MGVCTTDKKSNRFKPIYIGHSLLISKHKHSRVPSMYTRLFGISGTTLEGILIQFGFVVFGSHHIK